MIFKSMLLFVGLLLAGCAQTSTYKGGRCDAPCVITHDLGGKDGEAKAAAQKVIAAQQSVVIDGMCASACVLFADWARPNVCITEKVVFGFHMASETMSATLNGSPIDILILEDPKHSPDVDAWVKEHGGYPMTSSVSEMLSMSFGEAQKLWPVCPKSR